ncbi:MAG: O-methyltransferase [Lachnospiraceae bacterium]
MRVRAQSEKIPVIRRETESFLQVLFALSPPERILEIGAGVAYSAIFMALSIPGCRITTIENYAPRVEKALQNIAEAGLEDRISLIDDDASNVLPGLEGPYDFIFLDGAKGQYTAFLPELVRLMPPGGVLLADNVLQDGDLVRSRYAVDRRHRTIHERMREFVREVKHHPLLETSVITIGDGVTLSVRKQENSEKA